MNIDPLERAIAFLMWGGIALLVKGVIVFWEVGQKAIAGQNKINRLERAIAGQNKINRLKRAIAGQNKINRLKRAIAFLMCKRRSRFHQRNR